MEANFWGWKTWFDLVQTTAILFTIISGVYALREDKRSRKLGNVISLTANHRELWSLMIQCPKLTRIFSSKVDVVKHPPTSMEEAFVTAVILQTRTVLTARELKLEMGDENLEADVGDFFQNKVPFAIWQRIREYQGEKLIRFIDEAISERRGRT